MINISDRALMGTCCLVAATIAALGDMPPIGRLMCAGSALFFLGMAIWPPKRTPGVPKE